MEAQSNKPHRGPGRKTAKQRMANSSKGGNNPKAFAVSGPGKMRRNMQRGADVTEKKYHVPMVTKLPDDEEPPVVVGVVGPSGVGKSTLVKSLVKRFTKTSINEVKGPITLVSGKRRRLTIIEVKSDLNSMIDAAKIVDLVLLMIDGNYGLEMETFEFLNIAQHHGMPKVIGCVTHCDLFKSQSTLRAQKKLLKHRFWTEVYKGAKLFYLSGIINGRYPDREVLNLSRFVSVMKFRPLKWRNDHPYMLVDRVNDLTNPMDITINKKIDRKVAMYGYLHGTNMKENNKVHIAGLGDYEIATIEKLPDPVPTPFFEQKVHEFELEQAKIAKENGEEPPPTRRNRRKRLEEKQKIIYAPMSDVGGVLIDKDTVYIDTGAKHHGEMKLVDQSKDKELESKMIHELAQKNSEQNQAGIQLFEGGELLENDGADDDDDEDDEFAEMEELGEEELLSDFEEDFEDEVDNGDKGRTSLRSISKWKDVKTGKNLVEIQEDTEFHLSESEDDTDDWRKTAQKLNGQMGPKKWDLNKLIYSDEFTPEEVIKKWNGEESLQEGDNEEAGDEEEDFFSKKETVALAEDLDCTKPKFNSVKDLEDYWEETKDKFRLKHFFISPRERMKLGISQEGSDEDEGEEAEDKGKDDFADFDAEAEKEEGEEDEENAEGDDKDSEKTFNLAEQRALVKKRKEQLRLQFEEEDEQNEKAELNEYESWYEFQKAKMAKQLEINKAEMEKLDESAQVKIDGYKAGAYVKIVINGLPCEFVENFDPVYPIVVGGLLATETSFGLLSVRVRKHRWHKKILKSNDPFIVSLGWRRFQTLPIYTTSDSRTRTRMLKYTPEHAYCQATFYGPLVSPNTTFCCSQVVAESDTGNGFRIAASGVVEDVNNSVEIVKKLKLVGYPYKIFKNTAFIKDMFSTSLEVVKFEGAAIKTVSGIRGEIKRALAQPEGHFRATFEDKILVSDIVFLKTWYPVKVKKFYNPVTSLLMAKKDEWKGMRLTGKIRADEGIDTPNDPNSKYSKVERTKVKFAPLRVPNSVKSDLPFKSQISQMKPQKKKTYMQKRAVILDGEEKKTRTLIQQLNTIKNEKDAKKRAKKDEKNKERLKKLKKIEQLKQDKAKERKKEYFAKNNKRLLAQEGGGKRQKT